MGAVVIDEVLAVQQFAEAHVKHRSHNGHAEHDEHEEHDDEPRFREKEAHRSRFDR